MATKKAPPTETAAQTQAPEKPTPPKQAAEATASTSGWVTATLKTRHCDGGVCKEAGEEMRMTRGTYERLKQYGRVE